MKYIKFIIVLLIFLFCIRLTGQEYAWPTDASRHLTSSFAEYRSGHFHAGIDIKTWGKVGYKVFATRAGYIWKVRISPFGYGKVLYQVLDTGEIAVYGHLQKFSPKLETIMKKEQKKRQRYSVTKVFNPDALPVEKGQIIAYTGRTGIGHPHLHFELRKNENTPINPLDKNFQLKDTIPPRPTELAVIPFNLGSQVNGYATPQTFKLNRINNKTYRVQNPIQIWGVIGLSIDAFDQANGVTNKYSIHQVKLYINNLAIFQSTYQSFTYDETRQIYLDRNYWFISNYGKRFFNLYIEPGNTLSFYDPFSQENGIIYTAGYAKHLQEDVKLYSNFLLDAFESSEINNFDQLYLQTQKKPYTMVNTGEHQCRIVLEDYFDNQTTIEFTLLVKRKKLPEKQWLSLSDPFANNLFQSNNYKWYKKSRFSKWLPVPKPELSYVTDGDDASLTSGSSLINSASVYKIELINDASKEYPIFLTSTPTSKYPKVNLQTVIKDPFTVFSFRTNEFITEPIYAKIKNKRLGTTKLNLVAHDLNHFTASVPSFDISNDTTEIILSSMEDNSTVLLREKFYFHRIDKLKRATITSKDGGLTLHIPKNTSNQNLYLALETKMPNEFMVKRPNESLAQLYHIYPGDVPFFKSVNLSIKVDPETKKMQQIGIYTPNIRAKKWNFVSNSYDKEAASFKANLRSLGYFTLIRDNKPPFVRIVYPKNGSVITNKKPEIRIRYKDDLSKIRGEENFRLTLDGNFCIAELDPEMHLIKFIPENPLKAGEHQMQFWMIDRAGNQTQKDIAFTIKTLNP